MLTNPLWDYSLRVYKSPAVAELCLQLQDDYGLDINMLMTAAWLAHSGQALTRPVLLALLSCSQLWQQQCLSPIRQARRFLKTQANEALYGQLKASELAIERLLQDQLYERLKGLKVFSPSTVLLRENFHRYIVAIDSDELLKLHCGQKLERLCYLLMAD